MYYVFPCWQSTSAKHVIQIQHDLEDERFMENLASFNILDPKSLHLLLTLTFTLKLKKNGNNKTQTWA